MCTVRTDQSSDRQVMISMPEIALVRWGLKDYDEAKRWQDQTADRVRGGAPEAMAILEHRPVYTFGPRSRPEHLLVEPDTLRRRGAQVLETDRGGDVTFHGPGQLVGYPIINLRRHALSPVEYVRTLEESLIRTLLRFEIDATRCPGRPGVWVDGEKIGFIGVRVRGGVTAHGFALNVDVDLSWFESIVPCGLDGVRVTNMERLSGTTPGCEAVAQALEREFESVFGVSLLTPQKETVSHAR